MPLKTGAWATGPRDGEHALPSVPLTHEMKTSVVFVWAGESGSRTQPALALPWDLGELAWREEIKQIAGWKGGVGEAGT